MHRVEGSERLCSFQDFTRVVMQLYKNLRIFLGGYKDKDVRTFRVYFVFFSFICTGIM